MNRFDVGPFHATVLLMMMMMMMKDESTLAWH